MLQQIGVRVEFRALCITDNHTEKKAYRLFYSDVF